MGRHGSSTSPVAELAIRRFAESSDRERLGGSSPFGRDSTDSSERVAGRPSRGEFVLCLPALLAVWDWTISTTHRRIVHAASWRTPSTVGG